MKLILFTCLFAFSTFAFEYKGKLSGVLSLSDKNVLLAIPVDEKGTDHLILRKVDLKGGEIWENSILEGELYQNGLVESASGKLFVFTRFYGKAKVTALNADGDLLWDKPLTSNYTLLSKPLVSAEEILYVGWHAAKGKIEVFSINAEGDIVSLYSLAPPMQHVWRLEFLDKKNIYFLSASEVKGESSVSFFRLINFSGQKPELKKIHTFTTKEVSKAQWVSLPSGVGLFYEKASAGFISTFNQEDKVVSQRFLGEYYFHPDLVPTKEGFLLAHKTYRSEKNVVSLSFFNSKGKRIEKTDHMFPELVFFKIQLEKNPSGWLVRLEDYLFSVDEKGDKN